MSGLRSMVHACCGVVIAATSSVALSPAHAVADSCPPGHVQNAYSGLCELAGGTQTINGVPCVASNLGLCNSFRQNQQPPRKPHTSIG